LIKKAKEGVTVRFMYDAFGSKSIRRKMLKRLKDAGIKVFPFYKIFFIALANRINYRNHRKIIVVDGSIAFVGGINVADRYVNKGKKQKLFWRDTHVRIEGPGVQYLQYIFLCDWNFCSKEIVPPNDRLFPDPAKLPAKGNKVVQIASSGPDSDVPTILFSILQGINLAEKEVLISTPYFIPGDSIIDAIQSAALGGVDIKLLVPYKSDSGLTNAAAKSHYTDLLKAGVQIYMYKKGFMHAKTMVVDRKVSVIGTANMDTRSFDLNFEVNAIVYDTEVSEELADVFFEDLKDAELIDPEAWYNRPVLTQLVEKTAGLLSPIL
jgi:cardiolipin synthase A/B